MAPSPEWSRSDWALASIARLMRGFHEAAGGFNPGAAIDSQETASPFGERPTGFGDGSQGVLSPIRSFTLLARPP